jgi:hypothetical protein
MGSATASILTSIAAGLDLFGPRPPVIVLYRPCRDIEAMIAAGQLIASPAPDVRKPVNLGR